MVVEKERLIFFGWEIEKAIYLKKRATAAIRK